MPGHYNKKPSAPKPPKPTLPQPENPFDEQNTNDAAGKSTVQYGGSKRKSGQAKINPKTGMAPGWGGGAPRKGSSKKKWYGTGP